MRGMPQRFGANKVRHARKFKRDVGTTHPRNVKPKPMRGGWRL